MFQGDYFALELVEGLLYVHISMGGDAVKFRASKASHILSDGQWHKVWTVSAFYFIWKDFLL